MDNDYRRNRIAATLVVTLIALGAWAGIACAAPAAVAGERASIAGAVPGVFVQDQVAVPGGPDPLPSAPDPVPTPPRTPTPVRPTPAPTQPSTPRVTTPEEPQVTDAERAALAEEAAAKAAAAKAAAAKAARVARARAARIKRERRLAAIRRERQRQIDTAYARVDSADAAAADAVTKGVGVTGIVVTNAAGGLSDGGGAVNNTVLVLLVILAVGSAVLAKLPDLAMDSHAWMRAEGVLQIGRTRRAELIALSVGSLLLALLLIGLS